MLATALAISALVSVPCSWYTLITGKKMTRAILSTLVSLALFAWVLEDMRP